MTIGLLEQEQKEEQEDRRIPGIGSARDAIRKAFADGIKPVPLMTISEWADEFRVLAGEGTPFPGQWRTSRTPYLREIMDALSPHSGVTRVVFMKGTQLGATEAGNNVAFFYMSIDPSPIAFYFSKDGFASEHSKGKLTPSIRATPSVNEKVKEGRGKEVTSTVLSKYFPGGFLLLMGANAPDNFAGKSIRIIIKDEISRWPHDVGGEGDPVTLADKRADAFTSTKKIYEISSPTSDGICKVNKSFKDSDQRYYYVPCPYCGHMQIIKWGNIKFRKNKDYYRIGPAFLECENKKCQELIPQAEKKASMLPAGEWRPHNKSNPKRGYHLSSLYSPWLPWEEIVDEFLEAFLHREAFIDGPSGYVLPFSHLLPGLAQVFEYQVLDPLYRGWVVGGNGVGKLHRLVHQLVRGHKVI